MQHVAFEIWELPEPLQGVVYVHPPDVHHAFALFKPAGPELLIEFKEEVPFLLPRSLLQVVRVAYQPKHLVVIQLNLLAPASVAAAPHAHGLACADPRG